MNCDSKFHGADYLNNVMIRCYLQLQLMQQREILSMNLVVNYRVRYGSVVGRFSFTKRKSGRSIPAFLEYFYWWYPNMATLLGHKHTKEHVIGLKKATLLEARIGRDRFTFLLL